MNRAHAEKIVRDFRGQRILVIGDLILDEFIWGKVSRISPEAPVPVVEVASESYYPGGSANVARNIREFADEVRVMGLLGADAHAEKLTGLLRQQRIDLSCLQADANYQTIVKTRIIARQQQVVRVDRERKTQLTEVQTIRLLEQLDEVLPDTDGIIFEDYGKGMLQQELVDRILDRARAHNVTTAVDPHPQNRIAWRDVTAITPNRSEAFAAAGQSGDPVDPPGDDKTLHEVGSLLLQKWRPQNLLITLGEQGMMLFRANKEPFHIPTRAREVFDVSGAGDTAIALFTLALCAGATPEDAAELSNHASGIVVGKLGTAIVSPAELLASFDDAH
ncbi:MAG: bifunctional ADP-heptose synthase [Verrucomicrobiota bacterium]|nr:bifunctional ADP-heptose synthase [Verrucomicrobiota bacterium]